ncbi:MAG: enoyl-CoA hydratase [Alphaproteobacteria bacterium]|nr:MAG: enoyl-CoA hydratase [Alphaproteobacteria bacterium]
MTELVKRADADGVATLTLNRPEALNALSEAMLAALQEQIDRLRDDTAIRAVILRGEGKAFCAGHDLREMQSRRNSPQARRDYFNALFAQCGRMMTSLTRLPQPVIAQVHGIATAAGCQLVASCDLAVAARSARFAVSGVNLGLFCSTPMVALTRNVARKHAFEMLVTGDFVSAGRAAEIGLINRVADDDALAEETETLARQIAGKLAVAVRMGKEAFYTQAEMSLEAAYAYTGRVMAENMLHRDTQEGVNAFLEKRAPEWRQ